MALLRAALLLTAAVHADAYTDALGPAAGALTPSLQLERSVITNIVTDYKCCVCAVKDAPSDRSKMCKHTSRGGYGGQACDKRCKGDLSRTRASGRTLVEAVATNDMGIKKANVGSLGKCPVGLLKGLPDKKFCSKDVSSSCADTIFGGDPNTPDLRKILFGGDVRAFGDIPECEPMCTHIF